MSSKLQAGCAAIIILCADQSLAANSATSTQDSASRWLMDAQSRCYVYYADPHPADSVTWSGGCAGTAASGQGTATFMNAGRFVESVSANFQRGWPIGVVRVNWADGSHFEGIESAGHFSGNGAFTNARGDRFEGEWTDDRLNGHGSVTWANGDRYDGDLKSSKAEGTGTQIWADGHKYEGVWKNDLPNGHGVLTRKDGTKLEGEFVDGQPKPLPADVSPAGPSAVPLAARLSPEGDPKISAAQAPAKLTGSVSANWLDTVAGKKFTAVDGSSISIVVSEGGLVRETVSASGVAQKTAFTFVNGSQGTVTDPTKPAIVLGLFQTSDKEIDIHYADGNSETLTANSAGGISATIKAPPNDLLCLSWYPAGYEFSAADRQAALAEYAKRLGVPLRLASSKDAAQKPACAPAVQRAANPKHQLHQPANAAHTTQSGPNKSAEGNSAEAAPPISIRASDVHLVDAPDPATATGDTPGESGIALAPSSSSPSACLTVETSGANWGFRNHCAFPVQFAYCLLNSSDDRYSCKSGSVGGSIVPNGYDLLFAEAATPKEPSHQFRWIACDGGAGEVVPQLVRADPPAGRCTRQRNT